MSVLSFSRENRAIKEGPRGVVLGGGVGGWGGGGVGRGGGGGEKKKEKMAFFTEVAVGGDK